MLPIRGAAAGGHAARGGRVPLALAAGLAGNLQGPSPSPPAAGAGLREPSSEPDARPSG